MGPCDDFSLVTSLLNKWLGRATLSPKHLFFFFEASFVASIFDALFRLLARPPPHDNLPRRKITLKTLQFHMSVLQCFWRVIRDNRFEANNQRFEARVVFERVLEL